MCRDGRNYFQRDKNSFSLVGHMPDGYRQLIRDMYRAEQRELESEHF